MTWEIHAGALRKKNEASPKQMKKDTIETLEAKVARYDDKARALGYYFDQAKADKATQFIEQFCKQSKGEFAGKPIQLLPWQRLFIERLFGWVKKREDGKLIRRYREAGLWVGKKNGKSTLASAIALFLLVADGEHGAEVYSVANDISQASIVFNSAHEMMNQSHALKRVLEAYPSTKRIVHERGSMKGLYRVLSATNHGKHGYNPSCVIYDEIGSAKNGDLYGILRQSMGNRTQPLFLTISHAGFDTESIGYERYRYACGVRDGTIDDIHFLPAIYEPSDPEKWTEEASWIEANPSIGQTVHIEELRSSYAAAVQSPRAESEFRTWRVNTWVGHSDTWISNLAWKKCGAAFDTKLLEGKSCYVGMDLARRGDLAAYTLLFNIKEEDQELFYLLPRFFIPRSKSTSRELADARVTYKNWESQNLVTVTPGDNIDYTYIRNQIAKDAKLYKIEKIGFDPYLAEQLCNQQLGHEDGFSVMEVKQTTTVMSPVVMYFERLVLDEKIRHNNNPVLTWNNENTTVKTGFGGNIMIDKKTNSGKIDGVVAAVIALATYCSEITMPSAYETDKVVMW